MEILYSICMILWLVAMLFRKEKPKEPKCSSPSLGMIQDEYMRKKLFELYRNEEEKSSNLPEDRNT